MKFSFDDEQLEAINHFHGPALVVAGPGSGKTTVITNRIINLIYQRHIKPEEILVITFSKSAAISMQSRFNQIKSNLPVTFGTFHSVFYNIVRRHNSNNNYHVANKNRRHNVLIKVLANHSMDDNTEPEFLDSILKRISYYKNSNYQTDNTELVSLEYDLFLSILNQYSEYMRYEQLIDFEDMMLMCRELLENNSDIRSYYQNFFRYILIDEFQDINQLQFDIIKLLSENSPNLFVVGDDDQSIYGFRGANPGIMFEFAKYYKAKVIKLSCNHRCSGNIVLDAARLISHNKERFEKKIYSANADGEKVYYQGFSDFDEEYKYISGTVKKCAEHANAAILFRNNISLSLWLERFTKDGIKCCINEKPYNPFESTAFIDFMHYIKLSQDMEQMRVADFLAVMNKPVRYISRDKLMSEKVDLTLLKGMYKDKMYVIRGIKKLEEDLKRIKNMDLYSAFHYFRHVIDYEKYMNGTNNNDKNLMDDIQNRLKKYNSIEEVMQYINKISDMQGTGSGIEVYDNGIYLMTFHGSKGLEFDHVFIPDLMEGEIPSSKSIGEKAIEEERRMLYVAMTRARKSLTITYLTDDKTHNRLRSRFLSDIRDSIC